MTVGLNRLRLTSNERPWARVAPAFDGAGRYQPVSYWQETVTIEPREPLDRSIDVDVLIVGGGFSGLSTARELRRQAPNARIAVIERSAVGHGASGRNGGFAMPLIGWDLTDAVRQLGFETARSAYEMMYRAVAHLKKTIADDRLAADLEETGYLLLATGGPRSRRVREEVDLAHAMNFDHALLEGESLRAHVRSPLFSVGAFDPHPFVLNPAKLVRSLGQRALEEGIELYERTPLVELSVGDHILAKTPHGNVRARAAVLCLNGYGASVGFLPHRILPVHTFIILTEPLTDRQIEQIGWSRRTSLETARHFIHYYRLTKDNRILFGGEDADLFFAGRHADRHPSIEAALERRFRQFFPELAQARFTHRWGGVLGVTLDMFPTFGVGGPSKNVFFACGYSGHGVALSNYAGTLLAPAILERLSLPSAGEGFERTTPFFWNRLPTPVPPEPFRWLGMQCYRLVLKAHDAWQKA